MGEIFLKNMSAFEVACWEYEISKENGKFGIEIFGGLDKDPAQNPHSKNGCKGVYITKVVPGSPADVGGLKVGDQIYEANGYDFTMVTFAQAIRRIQRKDTLKLKVGRDASQESLSTSGPL